MSVYVVIAEVGIAFQDMPITQMEKRTMVLRL